jgi:hypothetical protein
VQKSSTILVGQLRESLFCGKLLEFEVVEICLIEVQSWRENTCRRQGPVLLFGDLPTNNLSIIGPALSAAVTYPNSVPQSETIFD